MVEKIADQVVYEDEYCRVWSLALEPGEATDWHKHEMNYVYVVTAASPARTEYASGEVEEQRDDVGVTSKREPDNGHRLLNVGAQPYRNIVVELKQDQSSATSQVGSPNSQLISWLRDSVGVSRAGIAEFQEASCEKPDRIAEAYRQLFQGYEVDPSELLAYRVSGTSKRTFGKVWVREIPFLSYCAHHFLPFTGTVDVAYLPGDGLLGLGKLPRLVQCRAQRFQLQERLAVEIVEDLLTYGGAKWARADVTARHACMCYRGPQEPSAESFTSFEAHQPGPTACLNDDDTRDSIEPLL